MPHLVLTRRVNESFMIGDDVKVTVLYSKLGSTRFCIDAPPEVKVWREEIYRRLKAQKVTP